MPTRTKLRDDTFDFGGDFVSGPPGLPGATIAFTVSDDGGNAVYTADKEGQSHEPWIPGVGHERNGVFFQ